MSKWLIGINFSWSNSQTYKWAWACVAATSPIGLLKMLLINSKIYLILTWTVGCFFQLKDSAHYPSLPLFWEDVRSKEMSLGRANKNWQAIGELKSNASRDKLIYLFLFDVFVWLYNAFRGKTCILAGCSTLVMESMKAEAALCFRLSNAGQEYAESSEGNIAGFGTKAVDELLKTVEPKALHGSVWHGPWTSQTGIRGQKTEETLHHL